MGNSLLEGHPSVHFGVGNLPQEGGDHGKLLSKVWEAASSGRSYLTIPLEYGKFPAGESSMSPFQRDLGIELLLPFHRKFRLREQSNSDH